MVTRRSVAKALTLGAGAGLLAAGHPFGRSALRRALAQDRRVLSVNIPGNSLGVHIPYMAALNEILPEMGYGVPQWQRVDKLQTITQAILAGSAEVGAGDAISVLRAAEAGADLRIVGNAFVHTSLVLVVNADKVRTLEDLTKPDVSVAVNSKGDFTHVLVAGPLQKHGIDLDQVNVITIGGSSNRMRALLAGRVDGVPLHFDQAQAVAEQGNYEVLIEPAKEFDTFLGEVWIVGADWLADPANRRAATDLLKATITAFRRANTDPRWYADMYRKYGTGEDMRTASDEEIEVVRQALGEEIGCWPTDMKHSIEVYRELLPVYKSVGAIEGTVNPEEVVVTELVEQALEELP